MSSDFCIKCDKSLSVYCGQCYDRILDRNKKEELSLRQYLAKYEDAIKSINFWLDEFCVYGEAAPDAVAEASKLQGDVLRKHLAEERSRASRLQAEVEELREWQLKVAEGTGYINRAEGQGGYEVAAPETIVAAWKRMERGY